MAARGDKKIIDENSEIGKSVIRPDSINGSSNAGTPIKAKIKVPTKEL
jgi:hypothetical protein